MPFATEADLEALVGHAVDTTRATLLLDLAEGEVLAAAGVPVYEQLGEVITVHGTGSDTILLPSYPVTAVASVTVDGTLVDTDLYTWTRAGVLERVSGAWTVGRDNVAVTYTHGYPAADIPSEFRLVTLKVAARALENPYGLTQESLGNLSRSWAAGMELTEAERATVLRALR